MQKSRKNDVKVYAIIYILHIHTNAYNKKTRNLINLIKMKIVIRKEGQ